MVKYQVIFRSCRSRNTPFSVLQCLHITPEFHDDVRKQLTNWCLYMDLIQKTQLMSLVIEYFYKLLSKYNFLNVINKFLK